MNESTAESPKSIVIIGCGAIGGTFAAHLANSPAKVTVVDLSEPIRHAVMASGLTITHSDGREESVSVDIRGSFEGIEQPDIVFFFVKTVHNQAAARDAAGLIGPHTVVATVQNGMGHGDVLSGIVPADRLVVGVTSEGANMLTPGHVSHYAKGATKVGPWRKESSLESAELVADVLNSAGLTAVATDATENAIWTKLAMNAAYSSVSALTRLSMEGLGDSPELWRLCEDVVRENVAVAIASGAFVDVDEVLGMANRLYAGIKKDGIIAGKASMLLDVEARRPTEVDAFNGAILREAARNGVDARLNAILFALIKGLEDSWRIDAGSA
ncbi:ketopantoate reductase family protein [Lysinimonas soli]|uniref:2-dehydropantoate 2-reductase n=1 Tax=Lysinimonas soli TaxID=1074233 RepID=A0ABW0NQG2_9MICO